MLSALEKGISFLAHIAPTNTPSPTATARLGFIAFVFGLASVAMTIQAYGAISGLIGAVLNIILGGVSIVTSTSKDRVHRVIVYVIGSMALLATFEVFVAVEKDLTLYNWRDRHGAGGDWRAWGKKHMEWYVKNRVLEFDVFKVSGIDTEQSECVGDVECLEKVNYFWHSVQGFSDDEYCPRYKSVLFHQGGWNFTDEDHGSLKQLLNIGEWNDSVVASEFTYSYNNTEGKPEQSVSLFNLEADSAGVKSPSARDGSNYIDRYGVSFMFESCASCGFGSGTGGRSVVDEQHLLPGYTWLDYTAGNDFGGFYEGFGKEGSLGDKYSVHKCETEGFTKDNTLRDEGGNKRQRIVKDSKDADYWTVGGHCQLTDLNEKNKVAGLALDWFELPENTNSDATRGVHEDVKELEEIWREKVAGVHRCTSCSDGSEFIPVHAQRHKFDRRTSSAWCSGICVKVFTAEGKAKVDAIKKRIGFPDDIVCRNEGGVDGADFVRQEQMLGISGMLSAVLGWTGVGIVVISFFGLAALVVNPKTTAKEAAKVELTKILGLILTLTSLVIMMSMSSDDQMNGQGHGPVGAVQESCATMLKWYLGVVDDDASVKADIRVSLEATVESGGSGGWVEAIEKGLIGGIGGVGGSSARVEMVDGKLVKEYMGEVPTCRHQSVRFGKDMTASLQCLFGVGMIAMFGYVIKEVFRKAGLMGRNLLLKVLCRFMLARESDLEMKQKRARIITSVGGTGVLVIWGGYVLWAYLAGEIWWGEDGDDEERKRFLLMGLAVMGCMVLTALFNWRGFRTVTLLLEALWVLVLLVVGGVYVPVDLTGGVYSPAAGWAYVVAILVLIVPLGGLIFWSMMRDIKKKRPVAYGLLLGWMVPRGWMCAGLAPGEEFEKSKWQAEFSLGNESFGFEDEDDDEEGGGRGGSIFGSESREIDLGDVYARGGRRERLAGVGMSGVEILMTENPMAGGTGGRPASMGKSKKGVGWGVAQKVFIKKKNRLDKKLEGGGKWKKAWDEGNDAFYYFFVDKFGIETGETVWVVPKGYVEEEEEEKGGGGKEGGEGKETEKEKEKGVVGN